MSAMLISEPFLLVLKATVLLGLGGLLTVLAGRFPASVRHLVWSATLLGLLALPLLSFGLPNWTIPVLPETMAPAFTNPAAAAAVAGQEWGVAAPGVEAQIEGPGAEARIEAPGVAHLEGGAGGVEASSPVAGTPAIWAEPAGDRIGWLPVNPLLVAWGLGTLLVLAWIGIGQLGVNRLRRTAKPVRDAEWLSEAYDAAWLLDIGRPVTLLEGSGNATPMTWGLLWPAILLPSTAVEWSAERRRMVLLHELAHVRRKDCLTQLVAHLACALFWFHPLVWHAARRLRVERERACDDLVVRTGAPAPDYADHLLHVARTLQVPRASGTAIAMARPSQLEGRLLAVLDPDRPRYDSPLILRGAAVLLILLLAVPLALVQPGVASASSTSAEIVLGGPGSLTFPFDRHTRENGHEDRVDPATADLHGRASVVDPDLQWQGTVRRGGTLSIHNANGPIHALGTTGTQASVQGTRGPQRRNVDVKLETVEHAGGVTLCVLPEGARCTPTGVQHSHDSGQNPPTVSLTVQVPAGVNVQAISMNGAVRTENIQANVDASSMNGAVFATATGHVRAKSMNGAVTVEMRRTDWTGELSLESMNGAVRVLLPDNASLDVNASTMAGSIRSDFPLTHSRGPGPRSARGTIGNGGRSLKLHSMNGSIRIERSGGPLPGAASAVQDRHQDDFSGDEFGGSVDAFANSMARVGESMAEMGVGIAESVTQSVLAAFGGSQSHQHRASPETLIRRLRTDPDADVRRIAAWGLSRADGEGVPALAEAVRSDRDAAVREMAAWSLGSLRDRGGADALRHAMRNDADDEVRSTALWALERVAPEEAAAVISVAAADRSPAIRARAVWLVGDRQARAHFDVLTRALRDDDAQIREKAAWSLGRLADARALPHLSQALDDPSPEVRKAALWAATRIDDDAASHLIDRAANHQDAALRRLALGNMAGEPWPWPWPWPIPMPRPAP